MFDFQDTLDATLGKVETSWNLFFFLISINIRLINRNLYKELLFLVSS